MLYCPAVERGEKVGVSAYAGTARVKAPSNATINPLAHSEGTMVETARWRTEVIIVDNYRVIRSVFAKRRRRSHLRFGAREALGGGVSDAREVVGIGDRSAI